MNNGVFSFHPAHLIPPNKHGLVGNIPHKVIRKVGEVAYELELPIGSKIHNVFHVSFLTKVIGQHISVSYTLPPLDDEVQLVLIPDKILKTRERMLNGAEQ